MSQTELQQRSIFSKVRLSKFYLFLLPWMCFGCAVMLYFHQSVFSTVYIDKATFDPQQSLYLSSKLIAGSAAVVYFFYMIMQILSGLFVGAWGARNMLIVAALCTAIGCYTPASLEPSFLQPQGRTLFGISALLSLVATFTLARTWFHKHTFLIINGVTLSIGAVAAFLGQDPIADLVSDAHWHTIIQLLGGLNILLALAILILIKRMPALRDKATVSFGMLWQSFASCFCNSTNLLCGLYAGFLSLPVTAFSILWGRTYLMTYYNINSGLADLAGSIMIIGMVFGAPAIAHLSNIIRDRSLPMLICAIGSLVSMSLILYFPNLPLTLMFFLLLLLGVFISGYSLAFVVSTESGPTSHAAIAFSITSLYKLFSSALIIQFIAILLAEHWTGERFNQEFVYSLFNIRFSMLPIPICLGLAVIIALLLHIMHPNYEQELS